MGTVTREQRCCTYWTKVKRIVYQKLKRKRKVVSRMWVSLRLLFVARTLRVGVPSHKNRSKSFWLKAMHYTHQAPTHSRICLFFSFFSPAHSPSFLDTHKRRHGRTNISHLSAFLFRMPVSYAMLPLFDAESFSTSAVMVVMVVVLLALLMVVKVCVVYAVPIRGLGHQRLAPPTILISPLPSDLLHTSPPPPPAQSSSTPRPLSPSLSKSPTRFCTAASSISSLKKRWSLAGTVLWAGALSQCSSNKAAKSPSLTSRGGSKTNPASRWWSAT